ncbi:MAG: cyclic nucleotide-gated ion channel [Rhodospirillales bacterium]
MIESSEADDWKGRWFDTFMIFLIVANVAAVVLETVEELAVVHGPVFHAFDVISVIVFTIEYLLRLWVVVESSDKRFRHPIKGRTRYALTPLAIIDFIAIAPFYLSWFLPFDLRFLRVFRLLRLLKLTRYSPALQTLGTAVHTQRRTLAAAFMVILILLVFASSVIYLLEHVAQPEAFASIPHAMWWGLATLTTVGYGDVTPISVGGKVFGALIMVLGIGMFAMPAGILATAFANEVRKREFVVTWRMVASVPLFNHLDALRISEIVNLLEIRVVPPRYTIFEKADVADAMYFISVGEVDVDVPPEPHRLEAGDFFGEIALLKDSPRTATVTTATECQLMVLYVKEFKRMLLTDPDLRENLLRVTEERLREIEAFEEADPST